MNSDSSITNLDLAERKVLELVQNVVDIMEIVKLEHEKLSSKITGENTINQNNNANVIVPNLCAKVISDLSEVESILSTEIRSLGSTVPIQRSTYAARLGVSIEQRKLELTKKALKDALDSI